MTEHNPTEVSPTDIALVGLAGRFPGAADAGELWTTLREGRSGITRFTDDQLRAAGVPETALADPDYVKAGAVVDGIDLFDAAFFGFNPKEAQVLDPQHRLFLEHSWHALEDAGCDPARFDGSIGVFAGCAISTYLTNNLVPAGAGASVGDLTVGLANDKDSLTLRVAHTLGLTGPAYGVQSYCSTSLVAVCAAASSLAAFECDLALAGGVAVTVPAATGYLYQPGGISSPDGECRAFDASGQGSLLGNGVGVVALRRLGDALADGDRVYAVIRGWAVNNDAGRKVGFTAPGVDGQARVVAEALAAAGLDPADIDYVEAHGTGTALGDAAELAALQQVFDGQEVLIGSVKTNLGHLDRAAGVTGLIKTALALHHGEIPATLNYSRPNPQLDSGDARLTVVTEPHPWPTGERTRRAGVSAFGIGGTNAHVVLEEAPALSRRGTQGHRRAEPLVWSARTARAADRLTEDLADALATPGADLDDTAYTLQSGRKRFGHRRALVADTTTGAVTALRSGAVLDRADATDDRTTAFLLPDGGCPRETAERLYATEPAFRAAVDECRAALPVNSAAYDGTSPDVLPLRAAGGTFVTGYALAALVRSWGVEPAALHGHGTGALVAACLTGALPLDVALALAAGDGTAARAGATPAVPVTDPATGVFMTAEQAADPAFWAAIADAPACGALDTALATLRGHGDHVLLEVGPASEWTVRARELAEDDGLVVAALVPAGDERGPDVALAEAAAGLWLAGAALDWSGFQQGRDVRRTGLPGYPFQRERYWIDPPQAPHTQAEQTAERADTGHVELLERRWTPTAPLTATPTGGRYLLVADASGLADALAARLRDGGARVTVAPEGSTAGTTAEGEGPLTVVHFASPGGTDEDDDPRTAYARAAATVAAWAGAQDTARFVVVTRGGQDVDPAGPGRPAQAAVATLPVVAAQEYPGLVTLGVDLDPTHDLDTCADRLAAELAHTAPESVLVAHRAGTRRVPSYAPAPVAESGAAAVRTGGHYLITGGLGDVGLLLAEHFVRAGASRVVLASRGGLPADPADPRTRTVERLRALGAAIDAPRVDVTDTEAVRALFAAGHFDGVVHAAADTATDIFLPLSERQDDALARHFGAKVAGARVLDAVIGALDSADAPRWCALFSSTSAHLGGLAFGGYAAANAALAAYARRGGERNGTRWISVAWDTWAPTLRKVDERFGAAMAAHAMTEEDSLTAFDRALAQPLNVVVAAAGGLDDRLPRPAESAPAAATATFPRPDLPQPYASPLTRTERELCALWTATLGVEPVGTRDNFFDLGGNSLLALQMLATVKTRFGVTVPTVTLFEAPTVHRLAAVLDTERTGTPTAAVTASVPPATVETPAPVTTTASPVPTSPVPTNPVPANPVPTAPVPVATTHPNTPDFDDPDRRIAIVGMAGRFPGAQDVAHFWRNVCDGVESITFFTPEELIEAGADPELVRDPDYVPARAVLDGVGEFDAGFFGMSPRMAALTDPQQRLFLEVCWEALEDSGYANDAYRERVGVFGGSNISTYLLGILPQLTAGDDVSPYEIIMSNDKDALTTSVSYLFDLHGPSVAVQTFCSTSLVGVHLAVQALRAGECEMALAGGVSIAVPDKTGHRRREGGMESHDGHVHTFDADARGTMFGDGATVVVLKRLSDALRDGDTVHAVIRGSAANNDGALKVGYTAPSVAGQAKVVEAAMADAGVTAADIGYVEAHGTATELGDPIEVAALTRAFGDDTPRRAIPIGAVKTNIGHLNHAAGTAGLIKTALTVRDRKLPATLNFTRPNPRIDFETSPFHVNTVLTEWPAPENGRPRVAGLNSLGMGGTNVHVVVEEPPARPAPGASGTPGGRRHQLLPVSARTATAADEAARRLGEHLAAHPGTPLADVAYTLQVGRKTFEHRRAAVVGDLAQAVAALSGTDPDQPLASRTETAQGRPVAFLFAGVGEQYPGLVGELYHHEPAFRAELDRCLAILARHLPDTDAADLLTGARDGGALDLAALLGRGSGGPDDPRTARLERTDVVQPLMFAVDHALARTLMGWGLRPTAMLGYSLGEYVAACVAGVLSLEDAIALVVHRARLIDALPGGAMTAVPLGAEELTERFGLAERGLDIAAVNGPRAVVVAGPADAVASLAADLEREGVPSRALRTTHAFHSRMLQPAAADLTRWIAENVRLEAPRLPYLSNVTGGLADAALVRDPAYWAKHMCGTVRFAEGAEVLLADPESAIVEIGPGQSLGAMMRGAGCPPERWPLITATLPAQSDPRPADAVLTECLSRLWLTGVDLDWQAYHGRRAPLPDASAPGRIPLPTYPFQRQRYWIERTPALAPSPADPLAHDGVPAQFEDIDRVPKLPEEQWVYQPVWRQTAAPAAAPQQPSCWLVFTDGPGADAVLEEIRRAARPDGATVLAVRPGAAYEGSDDAYAIRPGSSEDAQAMLRAVERDGRRLERVVHLWALAERPGGVDETVRFGLHTLVALARAAGELGCSDWGLDIVTTGAHAVLGGHEVRPDAATLIGPTLVVPLEYPSVATRLLDAEPHTTPRAIVAELRRPRTDSAVALRGGRRWVCDYDALPATPADGADGTGFRDGGVYLITGGLGGIGLGLARELAAQHQAKLVLFGRRGLPPRETWQAIADGGQPADEAIRERVAKVLGIVELGAEVEIVTGDVADPADVRRAIDTATRSFGALHGILHTAGVPGTGLMQFKHPDDSDLVLAPKVAGTRAIAEALGTGEDEIPLDFLVLFSSITSATGGGPGQVDYCAANAYLDGYAARLTANGRRVLSVDWGEWTWNAWDSGLSGYDEGLQAFFRSHRAAFGITFEEGWRCLVRALASGEARVVVSTQDLPTMVRFSTGFTVEAVTTPAGAGPADARHPRPELLTPYREPDGPTQGKLAAVWCDKLKLERVGAMDNFFELGGNSLLGIALLADLRRAFPGADLPPHILYEAPTVLALARVVDGPGDEAATAPDGAEHAALRRSGLKSAAARRRRG
ncbi:KR domain-containing protein [Streptomyces sp. PTM05]|uniref:KR domain-containing protein n=1 Tax=Streptantibioticus parmotrematis TaxID=2873249 RepID=A0ABS7QSD7_9ACTN|nr:type I polyketide synthase [Streptantibioticus parmotrematis]MBY8885300.1 KR domain-containing protein [Streptantibioticus parmotrematis]